MGFSGAYLLLYESNSLMAPSSLASAWIALSDTMV
jgi:hypothetical protein